MLQKNERLTKGLSNSEIFFPKQTFSPTNRSTINENILDDLSFEEYSRIEKSASIVDNDFEFDLSTLNCFVFLNYDLSQTIEQNISDIQNTDMELKMDVSEWDKSPFCSVCNIKFTKLMGATEHHCRFCGKAVCAVCSQHRMRKVRICDRCYLYVTQNYEEKKNKFLQQVDLNIFSVDAEIKSTKSSIKEIAKDNEMLTRDFMDRSKRFSEEMKGKEIQLSHIKKCLKQTTNKIVTIKEEIKKQELIYSQQQEELNKTMSQKRNLQFNVDFQKKDLAKHARELNDLSERYYELLQNKSLRENLCDESFEEYSSILPKDIDKYSEIKSNTSGYEGYNVSLQGQLSDNEFILKNQLHYWSIFFLNISFRF